MLNCRFYSSIFVIFATIFMWSLISVAQSVPSSFVYQGQITKSGGAPLEANPVVFNVRVYSPVNDCLMYEEQHSVNMLGSEGTFSLSIGAGIRSGTDYEDTSNLVSVFRNGVSFTGITTCAAGTSYNALTGHTRKVRIAYNDGGGSVTLAQDFHLQTVPYAWYANSLQGLTASNFVQINPGQNITQANLENLLGGTNYNTLVNLASGTSTTPLSMNNQQIKNLLDPTLAQDAATKNYADTKIAGANVDVTGVGAGVGDGRVLSWNATLSRWEAITPSSITDSTKLPLAGGTMAGNINMNGNQVLNVGHVTLQNLSTITLGKFDNSQETALVGTLAIGNKGATWYNSSTDKIMYWDGNSAEVVGNGSGAGDIEGIVTNAGSALSGGVTSGTATLAVVVDGVTIEVNGTNQLQVRDGAISGVKLGANVIDSSKIADGSIVDADINASAAIAWSKINKTGATAADVGAVAPARAINTNAGSGLSGGGNLSADRNLSINVDNSTVEIATNTLQVRDGGVTNAKINSVSITKISSGPAEYFSYMPGGSECTNNYTLIWDSTLDRWICGALPTSFNALADTDNDTRIQLEESADEDRIRFDTAGTERMIITEAGNVGIGTVAPVVPLAVTANPSDIVLRLQSRTTPASYYTEFTQVDGSATILGNNSDLEVGTRSHRTTLVAGGGGFSGAFSFRTQSNMSYAAAPGFYTPFISGSVVWDPTSGSGNFSVLNLSPTINQTGSASGSYTGILLNATETSVLGTSNRLIDLQVGGSSRFLVTNSGNVGIGSATPTEKLDVDGIVKATGFIGPITATSSTSSSGYTINTDSDNSGSDGGFNVQVNGVNRFVVDSSGLLGVGGIAPSAGASITMAPIDGTNEGAQINWQGAGAYDRWSQDVYQNTMRFITNSTNTNYVQISNIGTGTAGLTVEGNVGIGTTIPDIRLSGRRTLTILDSALSGNLELGSSSADADAKRVGLVTFIDNNATGDKAIAAVVGDTSGSTANNRGGVIGLWTKTDNGGMAERMRISNIGNVGIGTTSPSEKLQVTEGNLFMAPTDGAASMASPSMSQGILRFNNRHDNVGAATANKIVFYDNTTTQRYGMGISAGSMDLFAGLGGGFSFYTNHYDEATPGDLAIRVSPAGNVGIGTATPSAKISVVAPGTIGGTSASVANSGILISGGSGAAQMMIDSNEINVFDEQLYLQGENGLQMRVGDQSNASMINALSILPNANVGIGTTTPNALLHLSGNRSAAAWTTSGIGIRQDAATYTDTSSSGTVGNTAVNVLAQPTLAASSATTYTRASTLLIPSAPAAGANVGITNAFGLDVNTNARFGSRTIFGGGQSLSSATSLVNISAGGGVMNSTSWTTTGVMSATLAATVTDTTGSGTIANRVSNSFAQPTFASTNPVTLTNASTIYIENAPAAGTNTTITNPLALYAPAGNVSFGGNVGIGTTNPGQKLSVAGTIESTSGGVRFPDATTQATSAFGPVFYMNGGSVSTSALAAKIPLDTAFIDTNGSVNTGLNRVIPTKAGYYSVTGKVNVSMTGTGGFTLAAMIYKNGSIYEGYNQLIDYSSSFSQTMTVTTLIYVNGTTDYIELYCGTNSGTASCTGSLNGQYVRP